MSIYNGVLECPVCFRSAILIPGNDYFAFQEHRVQEYVYTCPAENKHERVWATCIRGTTTPIGPMRTQTDQDIKKAARHALYDLRQYKFGPHRKNGEFWLAQQMGIAHKDLYFATMTTEQHQWIIDLCAKEKATCKPYQPPIACGS